MIKITHKRELLCESSSRLLLRRRRRHRHRDTLARLLASKGTVPRPCLLPPLRRKYFLDLRFGSPKQQQLHRNLLFVSSVVRFHYPRSRLFFSWFGSSSSCSWFQFHPFGSVARSSVWSILGFVFFSPLAGNVFKSRLGRGCPGYVVSARRKLA